MNPIFKENHEFGTIVKISSVKGFSKWLYGKTMPVVSNDPEPFNWAYKSDYDRYINGFKGID